MKKFVNWILDHLKLVAAIVVFGVTFLIIGLVMLTSYTSYKAYENKFNESDLEVRSLSPAQPINIEIIDDYKSSFGKKLSFNADELNVTTSQAEYLVDDYIDLTQTGGSISIDLELEKKAFVDIVFTVSSEYNTTKDGEDVYGVEDLLSNARFVVNGETMEEVVALENSGSGPEWHNLVMAKFALPEGKVSVSITSISGKNAQMPQLKNITFFSSQKLSLYEAPEA